MESLSSRRAVARRSLGSPSGRLLHRLIQQDVSHDTAAVAEHPSSPWVRHAIAGVILALLGLVVAGSFLLTTTTDSTDSSVNPRLVAHGPDTSIAVPDQIPGSLDGSAGATGQRTTDDSTGTLDVYDNRTRSTSRQAVRDQLAKVAAQQQAQTRAKGLSKSNTEAREDAATEAEGKRQGDVSAEAKAADIEQARLVEVKRKAEEAARLAALKAAEEKAKADKDNKTAGTTGTAQPSPDATTSNPQQQAQVYSGTIPSGGAVSPIAPGSYVLGARWGAYGSWARYHTGIDISARTGTPIRAAVSGLVISDTANSWAGNHVSIRHADGSAALYAHMTYKTVSPGTIVTAGTIIGYVGQTGRAFGPHLHFEYYPPGTTPGDVYSSRDPWSWMYSLGVHL